ncbi:DUF4440 domain-containing protein [Peribacillus simplex]|uniref:DUF4440 domain-containing protein n=1 Tax=Peribacillus simplex TaxID=1478 RepID=UPI003D27F9CF
MENEWSSLKAHVQQLEEKLLKSEIRTSPEELSSLLKDDFFEFGSSGRIWTKSDCIGEEGIGEVTMILSDFDMHQLSEDTVRIIYRNESSHSFQTRNWESRVLRFRHVNRNTPT